MVESQQGVVEGRGREKRFSLERKISENTLGVMHRWAEDMNKRNGTT